MSVRFLFLALARRARFLAGTLALAASLAACDDGNGTTGDAGPGDAGEPAAAPMRTPVCTEPTAPTCTDESVLELNLFTDPNPGAVDNTADGDGWISHVDATGGGFSPSLSYVYARFTDEGLVRVDIGDEAAFDSMDWDIALRRFVIRVNSGVSGPSCVSAARTAAATDYDTLDAAPDGIEYRTEEYFTGTCDIVPDGSGLGSPGTALQSFWSYPGCVKMTGNVYVVRLANGRRLKLTVTSYYEPAIQAMCDADDAIPMGVPNGAGNLRFRWSFLEP